MVKNVTTPANVQFTNDFGNASGKIEQERRLGERQLHVFAGAAQRKASHR